MRPPHYFGDPRVVLFLDALDRYRREIFLFSGLTDDNTSTFFIPKPRKQEPSPESVERVNRIMRSRDALQSALEGLPDEFRNHHGSDWVSEIVTLDRILKDYKYRINPSDLVRLRDLIHEDIDRNTHWWWYIAEPKTYIPSAVEDKLMIRLAAILGTANLSIIGFLWEKVTLVLPVWGVGFLGSLGAGIQAYYLSPDGRRNLNDIWMRRKFSWSLPRVILISAMIASFLLVGSASVIPPTLARYRLALADRAIARYQPERAKHHLDIADRLDPGIKGKTSLRRGFIAEKHGDLGVAIDFFEYAARQEGTLTAYIRIAALSIEQGDIDTAIQSLHLGFEVKGVTPGQAFTLLDLYALALLRKEEYIESVLYGDRAIALLERTEGRVFRPEDTYQIYCIRGKAREKLLQYVKARDDWQRCLDIYGAIEVDPLPRDSLIDEARNFCDRMTSKTEEYLCE